MSHQLSSRVSRAGTTSAVPAHLQCSSCSMPLFNACQTPHGCRLCQSCVTGLLHPVEKRRCPGNTEACRDTEEEIEVSQATCLPDMATRREVARLRVRCPNCDAGCSVQLTWAHMDQHVDSCDFLTLRCELCDLQVMKKDMQRHTSTECRQRKVSCDLCSQLVTLSEMESRHRNLESDVCCPRFSAHCPHCSDRSREMDRRAYVAHLSECPERPVECKYSHLGCGVRVRRSDVEQHYRDFMDSHLELMDSKLRQTAIAQQNLTAAVPQSASPAVVADGRDVADVKRRVGSVFDQFKKLQVNVANWAHSTMELEQMADRFGGASQLRTLLSSLDERTRCVEQLQQQVQQLQQQVQQLQRQIQRAQ